jgi:hypothetical protein
LLIRFHEVWFIVRWDVIMRQLINDNAGAIGSGDAVTVVHFVFLQQRLDFCGLSDGYSKTAVFSLLPGVVASEEPGIIAHVFNLELLIEEVLKGFFNFVGGQEIGEIVHI